MKSEIESNISAHWRLDLVMRMNNCDNSLSETAIVAICVRALTKVRSASVKRWSAVRKSARTVLDCEVRIGAPKKVWKSV